MARALIAGDRADGDDDVSITSNEERDLVGELPDEESENVMDETKVELDLCRLVLSLCLLLFCHIFDRLQRPGLLGQTQLDMCINYLKSICLHTFSNAAVSLDVVQRN